MAGQIKVLVVDDDQDMRTLLRLQVEADDRLDLLGVVDDGEQAIAIARERGPDVVVLDLMMPVLGGEAALPKIREAAPGAKVILYTARLAEGIPDDVREGADAYLHVTPEHSDVIDTILRLGGPDDGPGAD